MIHGLAIASLAVIPIPWQVKVLLLVFLAYSMVLGVRNHALRSDAKAVVALTLGNEGKIELTLRDGCCLSTRLNSSSIVLHWLIALRLHDEQRVMSLFLLPDMFDEESWRRLSVLLLASKTQS